MTGGGKRRHRNLWSILKRWGRMAPTPPPEASTYSTNWKLEVGHLKDGCWGEPSNPCPLQGTTGRALRQMWGGCHTTVVPDEVAIKVATCYGSRVLARRWQQTLGLIHLYLVNRHNVSQERDWGGTEFTLLRLNKRMWWICPSRVPLSDADQVLGVAPIKLGEARGRDQKPKRWWADGTGPEL